jgi:hypothetical protein
MTKVQLSLGTLNNRNYPPLRRHKLALEEQQSPQLLGADAEPLRYRSVGLLRSLGIHS